MGGGNILIVEDEGITGEYLMLLLASRGYSVAGVVSSGEDAVAMAMTTRPDLVLMDIKIKGEIDGIMAAEKIMQTTGIPIIFVSAYATDKMIDRAMETNPCDYIVKPFTSRRLLGAVEKALAGRSGNA
jgi:CheY-like chemotaxis protein